MAQFADPNENRLLILEHMATDIRKFLVGSLIFSKVIWKNELTQKEERTHILRIIEEAEDAFLDSSFVNRLDRLENLLSLIHKSKRVIPADRIYCKIKEGLKCINLLKYSNV